MLSLIATIGANLIPWERAMGRVQQTARVQLGKVGNTIAAAFSVTAITGFAKRVSEEMIEISKSADRLEASTDQVQELGAAARKVGLDFEDFGRAIDVLNNKRLEALKEPGDARDLFQAAGLDLDALDKNKGIDLLRKLGEAKGKGLIDRESFGELLGTRSEKLFGAIERLREPHEPIFSKEDIEAARELNSEIHAIENTFKRIVASKFALGVVKLAQAGTLPGLYRMLGLGGKKESKSTNEPVGPDVPTTPGAMNTLEKIFGFDSKVRAADQEEREFQASALGKMHKKKLDELNAKIFEQQQARHFKKMGPGQQQEFLRRQITAEELEAKRQESLGEGESPLKRADFAQLAAGHRLKAEELRGQLQDLIGHGKSDFIRDPLSRIGGFNAFSGNVGADVPKQQLHVLNRIAKNTERRNTPHGDHE